MIKITAHMSKKVPIPGTDYSSQQYGSSMEIEVSDADRPEAIQQRIRDLYRLLTDCVDEQIAAAAGPGDTPRFNGHEPAPPRNGYAALPAHRSNGNGHSNEPRSGGSTQAQQRAIYAICRQRGLELAQVLAARGVSGVRELSLREASALIDELKAEDIGNGRGRRLTGGPEGRA